MQRNYGLQRAYLWPLELRSRSIRDGKSACGLRAARLRLVDLRLVVHRGCEYPAEGSWPKKPNPRSRPDLSAPGRQVRSGARLLAQASVGPLLVLRGGFTLMNCGSSLFRDHGEVSPRLAHAKPNRPVSFRLGGLGAAGADLCVLDLFFGL